MVGKWLVVIAVVIVVAIAWHQVFVMTGILWWDAPSAAVQQTPPPALELPPPDTSWIDMEAWQKTHPVWDSVM